MTGWMERDRICNESVDAIAIISNRIILKLRPMNIKLVESLAQVILSLPEEERNLLYSQINVTPSSSEISQPHQAELLDLEKRLKTFEAQYQMSSENFYQRFRAGELGDTIDFFEWSVFYEMWSAAQNQLETLETQN